jgi:esterase
MTTSTQPDSKTLSVNDLALHYLEWGGADAPDIVCVHGYTGSADAFNALARQLKDRFHILAPDVRGHGESAWSPAGAYQYADQAGDLAAFVDRLGLDRFVLIGTSMGGIIAMAYAVAHPQRLLGLVINDIGPDAEAGTQRITQMVGSRPEEFATLDNAMAYRREMSAIVAGRSAEDQRELALGVLRSERTEGGAGRWILPTSGSGSSTARLGGPNCGPGCRPSPARPWWCGERRATSSPRRRRSGWSARCRTASWSRYPASATLRLWSNRSRSRHSNGCWLPCEAPPRPVASAQVSRLSHN